MAPTFELDKIIWKACVGVDPFLRNEFSIFSEKIPFLTIFFLRNSLSSHPTVRVSLKLFD